MSEIKFGTDGWRGIIAEDFTFDNIKKVTQAIADYLGVGRKIAIGYDTRFMSGAYAYLSAGVLKENRIETILSANPAPSPMLSYFVKYAKCDGGIMITASHNPYKYNGLKFKEPYGCSSLTSTIEKIESYLYKTEPKISTEVIGTKDIKKPYIEALLNYVNKRAMRKRSLKIIIDSMYGAGGFYLEEILKDLGHRVITIHGKPNPMFPGINPEPIAINMKELADRVKNTGADIGIATDGDADRIGIADNKGTILTPHQVLSLLLLHLKTSREWSGAVAKTISGTSLINKIAQKYNIEVKETPVGFRYIAELMLSGDILIGGEESGGNGFKKHIPERDAFLSSLLLVEMSNERNKSIAELVKDMEKEYGAYRYNRIDVHARREKIDKLYGSLNKNPPSVIAGKKIKEIKNIDGIKFVFEDASWLLIRASGTEPILRIYAEAPAQKQVQSYIKFAKEMV